MREITWLAFSLFLLINSIGNIPAYISLLHGIDQKKQVKIVIREMLIALFVIVLFRFLGEEFLSFLRVSQDTVLITGGMILFLTAIKMVFPPEDMSETKDLRKEKEPFIVPLAIPLVAGPAVLAAVMIYAHQVTYFSFSLLIAIFIAWFFSLIILISSTMLSKRLGERGLVAIQRLMGLILLLMATEMFLQGIKSFLL